MPDPIKCPCCPSLDTYQHETTRWHGCRACGALWRQDKRVYPATRTIPCPHLRTTALRCPPTCDLCGGKGEITAGVV